MSAPKRLIPAAPRRAEAANANVLTREEAQAIVARAIGFSKAESVRVTIDSNYQGNVRFAANQMSTSGGVTNANVVIESAFGAKHAAVTTNDLSDESLRRMKDPEQAERVGRTIYDQPGGRHLTAGKNGRAVLDQRIPLAGVAHQCGTARFGEDPARSVLDLQCRAHELDNLYVVDTSFFPSSAAVNPALTAMANALRVGDHLLERLE